MPMRIWVRNTDSLPGQRLSSYAILIMNAAVWLLDKAFPRKRFGEVKTKKEAA